MTRICDYEGSQYRYDFWENNNRQYEDLAERIALRKMLPPTGNTIIEVGVGFGRTVDMYDGYERVILLDYARTQLEEAQRYLRYNKRFIFVVADVYNMPFVDNLFDALVMIRVIHHLVDVPGALQELCRIVNPAGAAIVEYASKRHWKSIIRWLFRRQNWNPFSPEPHEFVELNIDFHPRWMHRQFLEAGFDIQSIRSVSHYRVPALKKALPPQLLATVDGWMQPTGKWLQYTPSIFLKAAPHRKEAVKTPENAFFKCPTCGNSDFVDRGEELVCQQCHTRWEFKEGVYDFKTPLS